MNARVAQLFGGRSNRTTLASATTVNVPDNASVVYITGTTTVATLYPSDLVGVNRLLLVIGGTTAGCTFTNNNTPTSAGQMDLRGANRTLGPGDNMMLYLQDDKTWLMLNISV